MRKLLAVTAMILAVTGCEDAGTINFAPEPCTETGTDSKVELHLYDVHHVSICFTDDSEGELWYFVKSSDTQIIRVSLDRDEIELRAIGQGSVTIDITATDVQGEVGVYQIEVDVVNRAPDVIEEIDDRILRKGDGLLFDSEAHFSDVEDDEMEFFWSYSDSSVLGIYPTLDGMLVVGAGAGSSQVSLTARDEIGDSTRIEFEVLVTESQVTHQYTDEFTENPSAANGWLETNGSTVTDVNDGVLSIGATDDQGGLFRILDPIRLWRVETRIRFNAENGTLGAFGLRELTPPYEWCVFLIHPTEVRLMIQEPPRAIHFWDLEGVNIPVGEFVDLTMAFDPYRGLVLTVGDQEFATGWNSSKARPPMGALDVVMVALERSEDIRVTPVDFDFVKVYGASGGAYVGSDVLPQGLDIELNRMIELGSLSPSSVSVIQASEKRTVKEQSNERRQ